MGIRSSSPSHDNTTTAALLLLLRLLRRLLLLKPVWLECSARRTLHLRTRDRAYRRRIHHLRHRAVTCRGAPTCTWPACTRAPYTQHRLQRPRIDLVFHF